MAKSKIPVSGKSQYNFEAYNQRDVMGLPALSNWTPEQQNTQKTHNRILQPGFMYRDASAVLDDAKLAKADWITDVCCPSTSAAIMLHISKEMVTNYQVSETQLDTKAHAVYASLIANPSNLTAIEKEVDSQFNKKFSGAGSQEIEKAARTMLKRNLRIEDKQISPEQLDAAKRLVADQERRKIIDPLVSKMVKEHLNQQAQALGLTKKTLHDIGQTHDFAFFGAAGSGKSTITKQYVSDGPDTGPEPKKIDKRDCVILATDNYRAFTMPGTADHEALQTKDVFTRTQDIAYMVKELVQAELMAQVEKGKRPNLICDCVKLEAPMPVLLGQSPDNLVSKVAAYRGSPGYVGIAERVDERARKADADPADKGRFVETTSLLSGHATASRYLLGNIPPNSQTEILDTDVDKDANELPRRIAIVDSKNHTIEITDLRVMSEFLNKQNINAEAVHPVELIIKSDIPEDKASQAQRIKAGKKAESFAAKVTSPENKAKAILSLVTKDYQVVTLKDNNGTAYAELKYVEGPVLQSDNSTKVMKTGVKLEVLNEKAYKNQLGKIRSPETEVLVQITLMTVGPTMEAAKGKPPTSPEAQAEQKAISMQRLAESNVRIKDKRYLKYADAAAKSAKEAEVKERIKEEQRGEPETEALTERANAARRVLSAAIASPKIITGNYSAIMNCLNDVLTNTVTIVPEGSSPNKSPIFFIAEPMWLDTVDPSYDSEPWGQGIDAFPPAVQKFAQENLKPAPERGVKLTWGQVRELRAKMIERLETAPGFTVIKGEIDKVEQVANPESSNVQQLKIQFTNRKPISISFTGKPVVLDMSQRPREAGSALSGEPTILYHKSREQNEATSDVPIFCAGSGAQAAWVLDKMGDKRTYNVIYRSTVDFRIANAILGEQRYTSADASVQVDRPPLEDKLKGILNGTVQELNYKKDNGEMIKVKIALYSSEAKKGGENKKLLKATDIPLEPAEARGYMLRLGVPPEHVNTVLASISEQQDKLADKYLNKDQLAIQLNTDQDPPRADVGFAVNCTGWVALHDTPKKGAPKFWGSEANVTTGETLMTKTKLITTSSLLPGSGIPRMLAMRSELQEMRGETITYDVRALAFTEAGFNKMCDECNFSAAFRTDLKSEIKKMETPNQAGDPVDWIVKKYVERLGKHPEEIPKGQSKDTAEKYVSRVLHDNADNNAKKEPGMKM